MTIVYTAGDYVNPELLIPKNGEHVWVTVVAFVHSAETMRQAHRGVQKFLDMENIATVQSGCYICEEPFSERLSYRKCPGEPKGDQNGAM